MATHLDLEEQEQLDQLKHFWSRFGTPLMALVTALLLVYAGWNAWQWHQRGQASKAAALFDELDRAAQGGDEAKVARVFGDLKAHYPKTVWAHQGGLLAAKIQQDHGQSDTAKTTLTWVVEQAPQDEYRWVARLRLAGLLLDMQQVDEALKQLDGAAPSSFSGLIADRRGDAFSIQGKRDEAVAAYQQAWRSVDAGVEYRRLIEAKLLAAGVAAQQVIPAEAASGAQP